MMSTQLYEDCLQSILQATEVLVYLRVKTACFVNRYTTTIYVGGRFNIRHRCNGYNIILCVIKNYKTGLFCVRRREENKREFGSKIGSILIDL